MLARLALPELLPYFEPNSSMLLILLPHECATLAFPGAVMGIIDSSTSSSE